MAITLWSDVERGLTNTELDTNFSELAAGCLPQTASDNRPTVKPSLNLDFTKGVLDPRITFTRASTATYFGADGLLKTAGVNEPRFEYDPVTRQPKGLLIEEQRTNLLTYSEQFDNSAWSKHNCTVTSNAAIAPNGTLSADKIVENLNVSPQQIGIYKDNGGVLSAGTYTWSVYVKAAGRNYAQVRMSPQSGGSTYWASCIVDLNNGVITKTEYQQYSPIFSSVSIGQGWFRVSCTITTTGTGAGSFSTVNPSNSADGLFGDYGAVNYQGDGTSGIFIWGAQLEAGSFPTSYIPTTSAQVTRSGDAASIVGNNFLSWYRPDEGTFLARATIYGFDGVGTYGVPIVGLAHPSFGDSFMQVLAYEPRRLLNFPYLYQIGQTFTSRDYLGIASFSIPTNNASAALGGVLTDPSGTVPVVGPLRDALGYARMGFLSTPRFSPNPTASGRTHIQRVAYYPKRLTNTQLQELTK